MFLAVFSDCTDDNFLDNRMVGGAPTGIERSKVVDQDRTLKRHKRPKSRRVLSRHTHKNTIFRGVFQQDTTFSTEMVEL